MAMGLLQKKVGGQPGWRVESAGTWSIKGQPAAASTLDVLSRHGITLHHRSRVVTVDLLREFNLILTMEAGQKEALKVEFPEIADRVYLLTEMIGEDYDIKDPIGGPYDEFEKTAQEFERIFDEGLERITQLAQP
jgi:protein-tyrosine phosphatase